AVLPGDVEDVPKSADRDQRGPRAATLDDCVRDQRRAVDDISYHPGRRAGVPQRRSDRAEHRLVGIARRRERLGDAKLPRLIVEEGHVGEGPADIDADAVVSAGGVGRHNWAPDRGVLPGHSSDWGWRRAMQAGRT